MRMKVFLHKKKIALTIIELLIAVTIFAIVSAILYSSFRLGVLSWKRAEQSLDKNQKIMYVLNAINNDISNAFYHSKILFKGEANRIEFASVVKEKASDKGFLGKTIYFFRKNPDKQFGSLERIRLRFWEIDGYEKGLKPSGGEILLEDVIECNINYCYVIGDEKNADYEWFPQWMVEDSIPSGIEIKLILKDATAAGGKRTFLRKIYIPSSNFEGTEDVGL